MLGEATAYATLTKDKLPPVHHAEACDALSCQNIVRKSRVTPLKYLGRAVDEFYRELGEFAALKPAQVNSWGNAFAGFAPTQPT